MEKLAVDSKKFAIRENKGKKQIVYGDKGELVLDAVTMKIIRDENDKSMPDPLFVGYNGFKIYINCNEEVTVPLFIYETLKKGSYAGHITLVN